MEGLQQVGLPVLGIVAAAALTFYAVSFNELREKSLRDYDDDEEEGERGFKSNILNAKEKRAMRKAKRDAKS